MKNSKRTSATLKGAVLIMVMTIMFVLIFLLAGTIAVVYSAHNRAIVKYEESQAYYTARSLLDAYLDTFLQDNDNRTGENGTTAIPYYYFDDDGSGNITVKNDVNAKQGRALELDIYSMYVSIAPKKANVSTSGVYNKETNPYGGYSINDGDYPFTGSETYWGSAGSRQNDKYLHDWVKQYILDIMLGDFSIPTGQTLEDVRNDSATNNSADYEKAREIALKAINSQINDYKHDPSLGITDAKDIETHTGFDNYYKQFVASEVDGANKKTDAIYYRVPAGVFKDYGLHNTEGSYGKVADTYPDNATDAFIKIQLLERTMNLSKDGADYKMKLDGGNREKDHVKISVTVEIMLDGVPTTTSVIYANEYNQKPSSNKAIVSLSNIKAGNDKSLTAFGGLVSMATSDFGWSNQSATSSNIYLRNNLDFGTTTPRFVLNKSNYVYIEKSIIVGANDPDMTCVEQGATFFSSEVKVSPRGIGTSGHEVNIICEKFNVAGYGDNPSNAQVFAEEFMVKDNNSNGKSVIKGDLYCNYLTLSQEYIDIDCSSGDAVFKVNVKDDGSEAAGGTAITGNDSLEKFVVTGTYAGSNGKIHVAKGVKVMDNSGNVVYTVDKTGTTLMMADNVQRPAIIDWSNALFIDSAFSTEVKATNRVLDGNGNGTPEESEQDFVFDTSAKTRKFTMPVNLIGKTGSDGKVIEIDTLEKMYTDYFKSAATTGGTYDGEPFAYFGDFNYGTYNEANHMKDFDTVVTNPGAWDEAASVNPNFNTFIDEHVVQPQDRNAKVTNTGLAIPSCFNALVAQSTTDADILAAIPAGKQLAGIITSDCQIPSSNQVNTNNVYNQIDNWVFVIDTRGGPVNLQMGNGSGGKFAGNFVVVGTNKCTVLMPASNPNTEFILGDDHDFSLFDSRLGQKPSNLRLGNASNPSVPPAIDIVVSKNASKVTYGQHAQGPIQGYFYS
ncbi:MAG: hypothetical protein K2N72_03840, partial [Oscillospiraceae bacterium]|nr:hypothetical protein [Oscillospiraceae bacterium]